MRSHFRHLAIDPSGSTVWTHLEGGLLGCPRSGNDSPLEYLLFPLCHIIPRHPSVSRGLLEFCELISGKEMDFGKAYVKYYNHRKTGEPCKEVGIC
ncbi:hypothetical protein DdX_12530 [Ditylenchus destructor]|uniref:Uncharacterized protein n=1 Tax=Ditylenchus destructor TaxID=166010 RepID=A0AAD4R3J6_9BILA|nr:hypothetical protein DdX_12530 [Ditylenchus destructor]